VQSAYFMKRIRGATGNADLHEILQNPYFEILPGVR